jgi:hypothetical protein
MTELIQALIFGVLTGSVYALMATGLTLTFGMMKVVNLAQGAFLLGDWAPDEADRRTILVDGPAHLFFS